MSQRSGLDDLQRAVGEWGTVTFPSADLISITKHFQEESGELSQAVWAGNAESTAEEAADCVLLLMHLAHRSGFSLIDEVKKKFAINQRRTWHAVDAGYAKHDEVPAVTTRITDSNIFDRLPKPLAAHQRRVADAAVDGTYSGSVDRDAALYHDVVEDGYATWDEMAQVFSPEVIEALELLTHDKSMSYEEYIERIATSGNAVAVRVKVLDLLDHFSPYHASTFPIKKIDSYLAALRWLSRVLQGETK